MTDPTQTWREIVDRHVADAIAEVNQRVDAHLKGLFEEAFDAGQTYERDLYNTARGTDFETWFAALIERLRKS